jgi:hypothetical protein
MLLTSTQRLFGPYLRSGDLQSHTMNLRPELLPLSLFSRI